MKHTIIRLALLSSFLTPIFHVRASTNGDNLLGVGAASRTLGGVGVASPPDAIGALSANPAALSFLPEGKKSETDLSFTFFLPHVSARVGSLTADSAGKTYVIPSLAVAGPLGTDGPWTYGFSVYGVSGLGVDYRGTAIDTTLAPTPYPLVAGGRTELQILEVTPAVAYRFSPEWSAGLALHVDSGRLELGSGGKHGASLGAQPGLSFKASAQLTLGLTYVSPQAITYKGVTDFDGNGTADNLKLESPPQVKFGVGYHLIPGRLLVATDVQWVNWGGAQGYQDFDWRDSWVFGLGVQFDAIPEKLVLRAGYSFGNNPVKAHNGWDGTGAPANVTNVQGKLVNNYYYETFRIIGFPAIVEHHVGLGLSYRFNGRASLEAGYTHAFRNTITERGTNLLGAPVTLSSSLSEDSFELGFKYRF
ncbi:MAG: outer membrane protein transport protein [Opitutaceae bacterium]|nr:outer membrane protein transport protein [Opitutaceae bacterium]